MAAECITAWGSRGGTAHDRKVLHFQVVEDEQEEEQRDTELGKAERNASAGWRTTPNSIARPLDSLAGLVAEDESEDRTQSRQDRYPWHQEHEQP
jgi:hypothetical protein